MIERLRNYLEEEFSTVESTKEISDLKDELLANLVDKYEEMINSGYSQDKSFIEAVKSIGDLSEVIKNKTLIRIEEKTNFNQVYKQPFTNERANFELDMKRFNMLSLVSVGVTLFSVLIFFLLTLTTYKEVIGFSVQLMLTLIAGVIFGIGYNNFHSINQKYYKTFNDKNSVVEGLFSLRRYSFVMIFTVYMTFILTLPYILLDPTVTLNGIKLDAIIEFSSFVRVVPLFLTISILILEVIYKRIDRIWIKRLNEINPSDFKPIFVLDQFRSIIVNIFFVFLLININFLGFYVIASILLIYEVNKNIKGRQLIDKTIVISIIINLFFFGLLLFGLTNHPVDSDAWMIIGYSLIVLSIVFAIASIILLIKSENIKLYLKEILINLLIIFCIILFCAIVNSSYGIYDIVFKYIYLLYLIGYIIIDLKFKQEKNTSKNKKFNLIKFLRTNDYVIKTILILYFSSSLIASNYLNDISQLIFINSILSFIFIIFTIITNRHKGILKWFIIFNLFILLMNYDYIFVRFSRLIKYDSHRYFIVEFFPIFTLILYVISIIFWGISKNKKASIRELLFSTLLIICLILFSTLNLDYELVGHFPLDYLIFYFGVIGIDAICNFKLNKKRLLQSSNIQTT